LKPRRHLGKIFDQDVVAAFFAGTDGRSSDLPVAITLDRNELVARHGWGLLVLGGFVADRDTPYREVVATIEVEPDEVDPQHYRTARTWLRQLAANSHAFHTAFEQLGKALRRAYPEAGDGLGAEITAALTTVQRRLDALFFAELRRGLEAEDQGEGWRQLLREVVMATLDRFEMENPIEGKLKDPRDVPRVMKSFLKAQGDLDRALAKL
jgi:hypothetical protein